MLEASERDGEINNTYVRFQFLTTLNAKITALWGKTPCSLADRYQRGHELNLRFNADGAANGSYPEVDFISLILNILV
jgi:hypothetical protein